MSNLKLKILHVISALRPAAIILFVPGVAHAERVGYRFTGTISVFSGTPQDFFGTTLTSPRPVTGSFSYDTTATGVDSAPGERIFHQSISAGLSLDVDFGTTHKLLQASDYDVTVRNDVSADGSSPPTDQFIVSYQYNSSAHPKKLLVNGTEWSGDLAVILLALSWDPDTFTDPDEPKPTADRPIIPGYGVFSFAGSQNPTPFISNVNITATAALAGDYNLNGSIEAFDHSEWRKVFGNSQPSSLYADGDHNGIVGAGDYLIWRKALAGANHFAYIPEANSLTMVAIACFLFSWRGSKWKRVERQRSSS
jgi:hypothetical protein